MALMPRFKPEQADSEIHTNNENSEALLFIFVTVFSYFTEEKTVRDKEVQCQCQGHTGSQHPSPATGSFRYMARTPCVLSSHL